MENDKKRAKEIEKAWDEIWDELFLAFAKGLKIPQLLNWLINNKGWFKMDFKNYKTVGKCDWCDRYEMEVWSIKDEVHDCIRYECIDSVSCNKYKRQVK